MTYIVAKWIGYTNAIGCEPWIEVEPIVAENADHAFRLASAREGGLVRVRSEGNFNWYSR